MLETLVGFLVGLLFGLAIWQRTKSRASLESEQLRLQMASLKKDRESDQEKLAWIETSKEHMANTFTALAAQALATNSESLTISTKRNLEGVVDPLRQSLESLDGHVRELDKSREVAYQSLIQEISQIARSHKELREATTGLTGALRSSNVRGNWGEIQLKRVVELAGMERHVAFKEQASTPSGRPDMIIYLSNGGTLPLDAKVALESYLNAIKSSDEETRNQHLVNHAKAMREHAKALGQKKYWEQFEPTPEFVVMFVPYEACLGAAFEHDSDLMEYAIERRVLISSPVTLLALLRAVVFGWQQHQITENAAKIQKEGRDLYKRLDIFISRFSDLGGSLTKTIQGYNRAQGSLCRRLLPTARRLRELGISTTDLEVVEEIDLRPTLPAIGGDSETHGGQSESS